MFLVLLSLASLFPSEKLAGSFLVTGIKKLEDDWPESIVPQALFQPRRHLFTSNAASV